MGQEQEPHVTQGDALAEAAKRSPGSVKLLGDVFEHQARSLEATFEGLYENEKRQHEQTKRELYAANSRLALIEDRHGWLMGWHDRGPNLFDDDLPFEG